MSDYELPYTGAKVNELLGAVNENHSTWGSISQIGNLLWSGSARDNDTITVSGLSFASLILFVFDGNYTAISHRTDGSFSIGASRMADYNSFKIGSVGANITINGDQITFSNIRYFDYSSSGLGDSAMLSAGDASTITAIYRVV